MKATITRAALAEAAQAVKGLVSKDGLSAFSKIRLDASGSLSATGSNGDVQVEWRMDGDIRDKGTVTVPGTAFASFVGAMPVKISVSISFGEKISTGGNSESGIARLAGAASRITGIPRAAAIFAHSSVIS